MDLHTDQWWMPGPVRRARNPIHVGTISRQQPNWVEDESPVLIAPPACVNVMWMLVDFSAENGGTNVVPGSHLYGRYPNKEGQKEVKTVAATGPAGTTIVFDGRIWHGKRRGAAWVVDNFLWTTVSSSGELHARDLEGSCG